MVFTKKKPDLYRKLNQKSFHQNINLLTTKPRTKRNLYQNYRVNLPRKKLGHTKENNCCIFKNKTAYISLTSIYAGNGIF